MAYISQLIVHHENQKDNHWHKHKFSNRAKIAFLDVLMSFSSCETVPTELLVASWTGNYRTSSSLENDDPAYRTWLTEDYLLQIWKILIVSAERIEVDLSVMDWIIPLSLTAFTFKRFFTFVKVDWTSIMAFWVRTFTYIRRFRAVKLSKLIHKKCLMFRCHTA